MYWLVDNIHSSAPTCQLQVNTFLSTHQDVLWNRNISGNSLQYTNHKRDNFSCCLIYFSLICPAKSLMAIQVRIYFDLLCLLNVFLSKDTATAARIHLWLNLYTSVISGWFLSKCLLIKIIISHMRFTCSYLMINSSECPYQLLCTLEAIFLA